MKKKMSLFLILIFLIAGIGSMALMAQDEEERDPSPAGPTLGDMINARRQLRPIVILCEELTGKILTGVKTKKKNMKNGVTITFEGDGQNLNAIKEALSICKENAGTSNDPKAPKQLIGMRGVSVKLSEGQGILSIEASSDDKRMAKLIKTVKIKAKAKKVKHKEKAS